MGGSAEDGEKGGGELMERWWGREGGGAGRSPPQAGKNWDGEGRVDDIDAERIASPPDDVSISSSLQICDFFFRLPVILSSSL